MRLIDADDEIRIKPEFILYGVCGTPVIRIEDLARIINDIPSAIPDVVMYKGGKLYSCFAERSSDGDSD